MEPRPIFIAGIERSGTSLLYALLTSHPNIVLTRRTNLWAYIYNHYGDIGQTDNFERCLADLMRYNRVVVIQPDLKRLREDFWKGDPSYDRLFTLLWEQVAGRAGKPRWGDKSLNTERYADLIFRAYPEARILHIVRDPRDRFASALKRWKVIRGGVGSGTAMWLNSISLGRRNMRKYPGKVRFVRYESLASNPKEALKELCEFIGEAYDPAMLLMEGAEVFRDEGGNSSYEARTPGTISTSSIGRYRKVIDSRQVAFIQILAGREMRKFGYTLEPLQFSPGELLRFYLVDFPLNFLRGLAWRSREAYLDRTGRPIPASRIVAEGGEVHA